MSRTAKVLTPEQVKQRLRTQGITTTQWAQARGYTRNEVYRVLNGQSKAFFGKAHQIAVELGLKPTLGSGLQPTRDEPTTARSRCNPQKTARA